MSKFINFLKVFGDGQIRQAVWLPLAIAAPVIIVLLIVDVIGASDQFPQEQSYYFMRDIDEVFAENPKQANTEYNLSYNIYTDAKIDILHTTELNEITIEDNSLSGIILGDIKSVIIITLLLLIYGETSNIISSLNISLNNKIWFSMDNYKSFINIVKYLIAILITLAIFSIGYLFIIDDVFVNGIKIYLMPGVWYPTILASAIIMRIIAYVYKEGIKLHEEQMLTV